MTIPVLHDPEECTAVSKGERNIVQEGICSFSSWLALLCAVGTCLSAMMIHATAQCLKALAGSLPSRLPKTDKENREENKD